MDAPIHILVQQGKLRLFGVASIRWIPRLELAPGQHAGHASITPASAESWSSARFFQCALSLTPVFPAILQYVRGLCRPFDFKSRRNLALDYLPMVGSAARFRAKKRYIALKRDLR